MTVATQSKILTDTNVLLYCFDTKDQDKHIRAIEVVEELLRDRRLFLSVQILNEFFWNVTRPRRKIDLPLAQAQKFVHDLMQVGEVVAVDVAMCVLAMDCTAHHSIQYWDALLWAAAKMNGVPLIYTEDFQHDREIDGVRFVNPFVAA